MVCEDARARDKAVKPQRLTCQLLALCLVEAEWKKSREEGLFKMTGSSAPAVEITGRLGLHLILKFGGGGGGGWGGGLGGGAKAIREGAWEVRCIENTQIALRQSLTRRHLTERAPHPESSHYAVRLLFCALG